MAHNQSLQFIIIQGGTCDYINVREQALWESAELPVEREDVGLALFYVHPISGLIGCDLSNPGNNNTNAEWTVPIVNTGQYHVYMFAVMRWTPGSVWDQGSIVYHNGYFWQSLVLTNNEPTDISPDWEQLDCTNFNEFNIYCTNSVPVPFESAYFTSIYNSECVSARIYNIACNSYVVQNIAAPDINQQPNFLLPILIKVWNLSMTEEVMECIYVDVMAGETFSNIQLPNNDGVYIIEVGYGSYTNVVWDNNNPPNMISYEIVRNCVFNADLPTNQYVVYGICNIESCWKALYDKIMCKPIDPCCQSCDPEEKEEIENFRYTLNMINALWFNLMSYIELEQGIYMHMYNIYSINGEVIDPVRMNFIQHIADTIEKINELTNRCGDCNGTQSNISNCTEC